MSSSLTFGTKNIKIKNVYEKGCAVKSVILDFDGVIVDSNKIKETAFYNCWNITITPEIKDIIDRTPGDRFIRIYDVYKKISAITSLDQTPEETIATYTENAYRGIYKEGVTNDTRLFLSTLKKHGVSMYINSATPEIELRDIVHQLGIADTFIDIKGRPATKEENIQIFREVYGLNTANSIFIGDGQIDLEAAKAYGIPFIGIESMGNSLPPSDPSFQRFSRLDKSLADAIIEKQ